MVRRIFCGLLALVIGGLLSWSPSAASAAEPGFGPSPVAAPDHPAATTWCIDGQAHDVFLQFYVTAGEVITATLTDASGHQVATNQESFTADDNFDPIAVSAGAGLPAGTYSLRYADQHGTAYDYDVHGYNCIAVRYLSCTQALFTNPDPYADALVTIDTYSSTGAANPHIPPGGSYLYTSVGDGDVDWSADDADLGYSPIEPSLGAGTLTWPPCTLTATPKPIISGRAQVGRVLRAHPGSWAPQPVTLSYQWRRGRTPIAGATAATYRLVRADLGHRVRVVVTGSRTGYVSVSRKSSAVRVGFCSGRAE